MIVNLREEDRDSGCGYTEIRREPGELKALILPFLYLSVDD